MEPTELCWQTGNYTDDCICEFAITNMSVAVMKMTKMMIKE